MEKLNVKGMLIDIYEKDLARNTEVLRILKPMFSSYKDITSNDDKILRYVALMYDKNSPLKRYSIDSKKEQAAKHAGIEGESQLKRVFTLKKEVHGELKVDLRIVGFIHYYLKAQNDFAWSSYSLNSELFWQNQNTVLKGASDVREQETIMKLMDRNETLRLRLKSYEDEIFGDNKDEMEQIINFSVEDFVESLENI